MNKKILFFTLVVMILSTACTQYQYEPVNTTTGNVVSEIIGEDDDLTNFTEIDDINDTVTDMEEDMENMSESIEEELAEEELPEEVMEELDVVAYEGDLIDLMPFVMDPDGDEVELGFTAPFDDEGMWQTEVGDAGFYSVIVTATDNKDSFVTRQMLVTVLVKNKPPVINIADTLEFDEGELVRLNPDIYDEDGDEVVVIYSGWMDSRTYQTDYQDAGTYTVNIRADDSKEIVSKEVVVIVNDVNRAPSVEMLTSARITAIEGDLIEVEASATDPDGDEVFFIYGEPLDEEGEWQTEKGDAGTYESFVTATDGENEVTNEVLIEIMKMNEPPVIDSVSVTPAEVVLRKPGDQVTITISVEAHDPDGDELEVTYSGFMTTAQRTVEYGEKGGLKTITVTVSDGEAAVAQDVSFNMNNWPCFDCTV